MDKNTTESGQELTAEEIHKNLDELFEHIKQPSEASIRFKEKIKAKIKEAEKGKFDRTIYQKIDRRYDDIEDALGRGWTYASLVEVLGLSGVDISVSTFRKYLYRMRKKRGTSPRAK